MWLSARLTFEIAIMFFCCTIDVSATWTSTQHFECWPISCCRGIFFSSISTQKKNYNWLNPWSICIVPWCMHVHVYLCISVWCSWKSMLICRTNIRNKYYNDGGALVPANRWWSERSAKRASVRRWAAQSWFETQDLDNGTEKKTEIQNGQQPQRRRWTPQCIREFGAAADV